MILSHQSYVEIIGCENLYISVTRPLSFFLDLLDLNLFLLAKHVWVLL